MKKISIIFSVCLLSFFLFAKGHFGNTSTPGPTENAKENLSSPAAVPAVTTTSFSNVLQVTATISSNVTSTGGETLTAKGVCWSTSTGPTISLATKTNEISGGTGTGVYTSKIYNLKPVTTYYVRAYATNASGTVYGNELTITTADFVNGSTGGRKYYFSSTGSDASGTGSITAPWQTLNKITQISVAGNGTIQPGDTLAFKCGETFSGNITNNSTGGFSWNDGGTYWTATNGTAEHPVVFTSYGTGSKPNWIYGKDYPQTAVRNHYVNGSLVRGREGRGIFSWEGVSHVVVDGIQCNDTRMTDASKNSPAYSGGLIIGEFSSSSGGLQNSSASDTNRRVLMVKNFIIRNCDFTKCQYGIQGFAGINSTITNCTFTNLKAAADTFGTHDVGAGAIEALYGFNCQITNNYFKGAWSKSGRISSTNGLAGVALDIFTLKNTRIAYNTFIDCSGAYEIGNLDNVDSANGAQYDTFAFNKVINCGDFGYTHVANGDAFAGNSHHLYFWNNLIISNNKDRHFGPGFGDDVYGDGQGFAQQMWFFRDKASTWNQAPKNPRVNTTKGSYNITVNSASDTVGIKVGSVAYAEWRETSGSSYLGDDDTLLGIVPKTTTVTAISGLTITLSDTCTATRTQTKSIAFYLPVSDPIWSAPLNSAVNNYVNHKSAVAYNSDVSKWGNRFDTMYDFRNNIVYASSGGQIAYTTSERTKFKRNNNLFILRGNWVYPTIVCTGNQLRTGERVLTSSSKMFLDTTASYPENWDVHLMDTTATATPGSSIPATFTKDFAGNTITGPFVGLYAYGSPSAGYATVTTNTTTAITATTATSGGNITSNGGAAVTRSGLVYSTGAITDTTSTTGGGKIIGTATLGSFASSITGLTESTTYHTRAFAVNSAGVAYGADSTFTTTNARPIITTTAATSIAVTTALTGGNVTSAGTSTIRRRGLIYSTSTITDTTNTTGGGKIIATGTTGAFNTSLSGLAAGTTYYIKAFALNTTGVSYGATLSFTTAAGTPIVTTNATTAISYTTATAGSTVSIPTGGTAITSRGILYSTSTITDTTNVTGRIRPTTTTGSGTFTVALTSLLPGALYYVRGYARNTSGVTLGNQLTFTTLAATVPVVTTTATSNITTTGGRLAGNVTANGGTSIIRRGVIYSTSAITDTTSTTGGGKAIAATAGTGSYTITVAGLLPKVTYYTRAFAVNSTGVGYGAQLSFITTAIAPTITSFTPTSGTTGTALTINGTNFLGVTGVAINGVPVTAYTVVSSSRITTTVNSAATTGKITVTTTSGTATSTGTFTKN